MKRFLFCVLVVMTIACPALLADTLQFSSGVWPQHGNYYVGPYTMIYTPTNGTAQDIPMWCVSYFPNPDEKAYPVTITDVSNDPYYQKLAWLTEQVGVSGNDLVTWAIWYLVDIHNPNQAYNDMKSWYGQTFADAAVKLASSAELFTGEIELYHDSNTYQDMIRVPEPELIILLGLGLFAVGFAAKRMMP